MTEGTVNNICHWNDCGWCYAPKSVNNNNVNGACVEPEKCPANNRCMACNGTKLTTELYKNNYGNTVCINRDACWNSYQEELRIKATEQFIYEI